MSDQSKRRLKRRLSKVAGVLLVLALYAASIGPVALLDMVLDPGPDNVFAQAIAWIYAPVVLVAKLTGLHYELMNYIVWWSSWA